MPTASIVLGLGSTLTHPTMVVELTLPGLTTQQISRRIYHTPEAVDQYLRTFDRVLMLRLPASQERQLQDHGPPPTPDRRAPGAGGPAFRN